MRRRFQAWRAQPQMQDSTHRGLPEAVIDFPRDTTRAIISMLSNGTFEKYPGGVVYLVACGRHGPFSRGSDEIIAKRRSGNSAAAEMAVLRHRVVWKPASDERAAHYGGLIASPLRYGFPFVSPERITSAVEGITNSSLVDWSQRTVGRDKLIPPFSSFAS
jgi:hypothetical protein